MIKIDNPIHKSMALIVDFFLKSIFLCGQTLGIWHVNKCDLKEIAPSRILIIEEEPIGDVILSTAVYSAIRKKYPLAQISVMVSSWAKDILANNPHLDELVLHDVPWVFSDLVISKKGFLNHLRYLIFSYAKIYQEIRKKRYDLGMDLRGDLRNIFLFLTLTGIEHRLSFDRSGGDYFLSKAVDFNKSEHLIDKNKRLLKELGIEHNDEKPSLFPTKEDRKKIDSIFKINNLQENTPICIIHPGARSWVRILDFNKYAAVADYVAVQYGMKIVLTGSPEDKKWIEKIISKSQSKILDLSGDLTLMQLAALLEKAKLWIGPDTGMMHMAAVFSIPTVALFGPDRPCHTRPYQERAFIVDKKFSCSPCLQKKCKFVKNDRSGCMEAISIDDITEAIGRLLEKQPLELTPPATGDLFNQKE